ncbi:MULTISPECIES: hypothetical protein [unclassified Janthinobacterium]|uniref:hypothetical protein n=1 Tax=unclassified Janthinobacterium TaxID=2610881 RepID=UPI0018CA3DF7|nr:hypothetical protein [Janthinobacterium sp. CG_23.4]MDH6160028.1 hypothetical protein [Janthinobacterium sp. CG_23.4]
MRLPPSLSPYLVLRLRLAHHALLQFVASLASSMEILVFLAGPVLLGLLSVIALPGFLAVSLPWPAALGLLSAQILLTCLPAWLLRQRLLPAPIAAWLRQLPLTRRLRWQADVAVAALLMLPLGLAYAVSTTIWLLQSPPWLRPLVAPGIATIIAAWLLAWLLTTCIVAQRLRAPRPAPRARPTTMSAYVPQRPRWRSVLLWRQLFWLPFWRHDNMVGIEQSVLLATAGASMLAWLLRAPLVPAPLLGLLASASLVILTDRGDKAVREQIDLLHPSLNAWPLASATLTRLACAASLLPPFAVLLAGGILLYNIHPAALQQRVTSVYGLTASAALLAIVGLPRLTARGRVVLVVLSILALSAIGSELWN